MERGERPEILSIDEAGADSITGTVALDSLAALEVGQLDQMLESVRQTIQQDFVVPEALLRDTASTFTVSHHRTPPSLDLEVFHDPERRGIEIRLQWGNREAPASRRRVYTYFITDEILVECGARPGPLVQRDLRYRVQRLFNALPLSAFEQELERSFPYLVREVLLSSSPTYRTPDHSLDTLARSQHFQSQQDVVDRWVTTVTQLSQRSYSSQKTDATAEKLLVSLLSKSQRKELQDKQYFSVPTHRGVFKVHRQWTNSVSDERGARYCLVTPGLPLADQLAALKLLLESDVEFFLKHAIKSRDVYERLYGGGAGGGSGREVRWEAIPASYWAGGSQLIERQSVVSIVDTTDSTV